MKILVFHQPYPMGNYRLNQVIAEYFESSGHEVYTLEQLNGRPANEDYIQAILDLDVDLCYYEMLDIETFKIVERLKCQRILLQASGGVLGDYDKIIDYKGKWYDKILTNSVIMYNKFKQNGIPTEHFKFYHSVITDTTYNPKYSFNCVFLGMGFNRLTDPQYQLERDLFFGNYDTNLALFGNGWQGHPNWKGLLPPDDIGNLYGSAKSAVSIIAKGQREHGMINNRVTEIAMSNCPMIAYNYDTIDWFGADKYINFVDNNNDVNVLINNIISYPESYTKKANDFKQFMITQDKEFYEKLEHLITL